jgi:YNFM family putative membrane transporter
VRLFHTGARAPEAEADVVNWRYLAVATAGSSAAIDLYATQPLLPALRTAFSASEAGVGMTISALTLACALSAPFVGSVADRVGRKRVIVSAIALLGVVTIATASATTLGALVAWRFAQGLFMPAIFAVTLAYIAEEFPTSVGGRTVGAYIGGNVFGGFFGRYFTALVADKTNWHVAFVALGAINLAGAAIVLGTLPRSRRFVRSTSLRASLEAIRSFVRNPVLVATDVVGGSILFTLVGAFTYATFHLAAAPFSLGTVALGNVFCVYLLGVVASPLSGRLVDRFGHRTTLLLSVGTSALGMCITLVPNVAAIVIGLALMASGVFCAAAASQGYVGVVATGQRSTAAALYLSVYYAGGAAGAVVPALVWSHGGWGATVALILATQIGACLLAVIVWPARPAARQGRYSSQVGGEGGADVRDQPPLRVEQAQFVDGAEGW